MLFVCTHRSNRDLFLDIIFCIKDGFLNKIDIHIKNVWTIFIGGRDVWNTRVNRKEWYWSGKVEEVAIQQVYKRKYFSELIKNWEFPYSTFRCFVFHPAEKAFANKITSLANLRSIFSWKSMVLVGTITYINKTVHKWVNICYKVQLWPKKPPVNERNIYVDWKIEKISKNHSFSSKQLKIKLILSKSKWMNKQLQVAPSNFALSDLKPIHSILIFHLYSFVFSYSSWCGSFSHFHSV